MWKDGTASGKRVRVFTVGGDMVTPPGLDVTSVGEVKYLFMDHASKSMVGFKAGDTIVDDGKTIRLAGEKDAIEIDPPPAPAVAARAARPPFQVDSDTIITPFPAGPFVAGDIVGTVYVFQKGEGLPDHVHVPARNHISVVALGSFVCSGRPNIEGVIIEAGQIINWTAGERHGFTAREYSIMVQIRKSDQP